MIYQLYLIEFIMKSYKTKENEIVNLLEDSDIEYGSNNNGSYIKMANGVLICYGIVNIKPNIEFKSWIFPHEFVNNDYIVLGNRSWWNGAYGNISFGASDNKSVTVYIIDNDYGILKDRAGKIIAIGRWK